MLDALLPLLAWVLFPHSACACGFALVDSVCQFFECDAEHGPGDLPAWLHAERLPPWVRDKLLAASRLAWLAGRLLVLSWRACRFCASWCAWLLDNPPPLLVLSAACAWGNTWVVWLVVPEGTWGKLYLAAEEEVKAATSLRMRPHGASKSKCLPVAESNGASQASSPRGAPATEPGSGATTDQSSPRLSSPGTPEREESRGAASAAASPGQTSPHEEPCEAAASAPTLASSNPGSAAVGVAPAAPASEAATAEGWRAKLAPYTDGALGMLSLTLQGAVKLTAASVNVERAVLDTWKWQCLGKGGFGTVVQLLVPWPQEVLPLVQSAFPALTAGLPLVAKVIEFGRGADGTYGRAWRKREARQCQAANACCGFARLLRAHHGLRASVLLYECATVAPRSLSQCVADLRAAGATHMPAEQVCSLVRQVASALGSLHAPHGGGGGGVVHNDIKPDNLIVHGEGACVQAIDLGLALPVGSTVGEHGICGTALFMPPELRVAACRPQDSPERAAVQYLPCNDWYSLGAVAAFLMTLGGTEYHAVVGAAFRASALPSRTTACMGNMRAVLCRLPGATEGLVQLVLALMGPREQRPQDYAALQPLLEEAAADSRPAVVAAAPALEEEEAVVAAAPTLEEEEAVVAAAPALEEEEEAVVAAAPALEEEESEGEESEEEEEEEEECLEANGGWALFMFG